MLKCHRTRAFLFARHISRRCLLFQRNSLVLKYAIFYEDVCFYYHVVIHHLQGGTGDKRLTQFESNLVDIRSFIQLCELLFISNVILKRVSCSIKVNEML